MKQTTGKLVATIVLMVGIWPVAQAKSVHISKVIIADVHVTNPDPRMKTFRVSCSSYETKAESKLIYAPFQERNLEIVFSKQDAAQGIRRLKCNFSITSVDGKSVGGASKNMTDDLYKAVDCKPKFAPSGECNALIEF